MAGAAKLRVTQWARATKTDTLDGRMLIPRLAITLTAQLSVLDIDAVLATMKIVWR